MFAFVTENKFEIYWKYISIIAMIMNLVITNQLLNKYGTIHIEYWNRHCYWLL